MRKVTIILALLCVATFAPAIAEEPPIAAEVVKIDEQTRMAKKQIWNGTVDTEWYWDNESQTEFTITTAAQLAGLVQLVNGGNSFSGKTIKLGANVILNDTTNWQIWGTATNPTNTWMPIGSYTNENNNRSFSGTFDGSGYVVSGVYIKNSNNYQGLFGYVDSGAIIKNLGVTASFVKGKNYVGGLVGNNSGTITNCYTAEFVEGGNYSDGYYLGGYNNDVSYAGGLVGNNNGTITNCYTAGNVKGGSNTGGLVGNNSGTIKDCYATENVKGGSNTGGLVGNNSGTITNCYATGNVSGNSAGGLVGSNKGGTITNCYATGNVSGNSAGGLVGGNNSGTITNCYAIGNVGGIASGGWGSPVGGLVGKNEGGTITNCYATGDVKGNGAGGSVGGLVGKNEGGIITDCYAMGDVKRTYKYGSAGGLVGSNYNNGTITNCYATGNVEGTSTDDSVGGLVGDNGGGTITNCYTTGNALGNIAGGLVGKNEGGTITNCYATGNASGNVAGGLVGENYEGSRGVTKPVGNKKNENKSKGTIENCYATGKVFGTSASVGGLVGKNNDSEITNSYYDRQASGQSDIVKGEPKSTAQMKQQETFADWDFDNIWIINDDKNSGYPYLQSSESKTDTVRYKYTHKVQEGKVLTDKRDSKKYKTVIIGTQTWMAENLNYNAKGSKCYDDKPANCKEYGRLYNWATAMKSCPSGWHLPTNAEWDKLYSYADLYASDEADKYLKAKSGWKNSFDKMEWDANYRIWVNKYRDNNGTDEFGFSALPSGGGYGFGDWWSATEHGAYDAYSRRYVNYYGSDVPRNYHGKYNMYSVRCLQD